MTGLPGYDEWKESEPEPPFSDDPDCACTTRRRDKWCPVHGRDPDDELDDPDCICTRGRPDKWCPIHGLDPDDELDKLRERRDWR